MKKVFGFLFVTVLIVLSFAQTVQILVKPIDASLPDSLFKSTGSKTFNIQYLKLFSDNEAKAYIIKAWYFQPSNVFGGNLKFKMKFVDEKNKKEHIYEFQGIKDRSYFRLKPIFVLCPSNMKIFINDVLIPEEKSKNEEMIIPVQTGDLGGAIMKVLQRAGSGYREISENDFASKDEEIFIQIIAGTFPTGGYRLELNEPDIVFPITGKRGKITITGKFYRPGKGDMVTQAFTTPSKTISLGKLPVGEYDIYVNIEDLGEFISTLKVK